MTVADARLRWLAVCVLMLSSALNYLDRMVLSALMPTLRQEFQITGEELGFLISAFSIVYGLSSPLMGWMIDRIGLTLGACIVVGLWSIAGVSTGFAGSFAGLLVCRSFLGFAEAGGIPATGKASAVYLEPSNRALGGALSQVGLTIGIMGAPILVEWLSARYGWRGAFVVSGLLGFIWIPLWLAVARIAPRLPEPKSEGEARIAAVLRDRRFQALIVANVLAMGVYALWTVWVTYFLVSAYKMTQADANLQLAWLPPMFATLGGLFGGWLAQKRIAAGAPVIATRIRISLYSAGVVLVTALAPVMPSPGFAIAAICISLGAVTCLSVNYYTLPLDLYGAGRAAFGVSFLTGAYGFMQAFLAPQIGRWSDTVGWQPVCTLVAVLPLVSVGILWLALRRE